MSWKLNKRSDVDEGGFFFYLVLFFFYCAQSYSKCKHKAPSSSTSQTSYILNPTEKISEFEINVRHDSWLDHPPRRHHRHVIILASHRILKKDIWDTAGWQRSTSDIFFSYMDSLNSHRRVRENVMLMKINLRSDFVLWSSVLSRKTKSKSINKTELLARIR